MHAQSAVSVEVASEVPKAGGVGAGSVGGCGPGAGVDGVDGGTVVVVDVVGGGEGGVVVVVGAGGEVDGTTAGAIQNLDDGNV